MNALRRFNKFLAEKLADLISTMPLFYACNAFIIVCLLLQPPSGAPGWAAFISSNWFQLVALPVLAIANRVDIGRLTKYHQDEIVLLRKELKIIRELASLSAAAGAIGVFKAPQKGKTDG